MYNFVKKIGHMSMGKFFGTFEGTFDSSDTGSSGCAGILVLIIIGIVLVISFFSFAIKSVIDFFARIPNDMNPYYSTEILSKGYTLNSVYLVNQSFRSLDGTIIPANSEIYVIDTEELEFLSRSTCLVYTNEGMFITDIEYDEANTPWNKKPLTYDNSRINYTLNNVIRNNYYDEMEAFSQSLAEEGITVYCGRSDDNFLKQKISESGGMLSPDQLCFLITNPDLLYYVNDKNTLKQYERILEKHEKHFNEVCFEETGTLTSKQLTAYGIGDFDSSLAGMWGIYSLGSIGPAGGIIFYDCDKDNDYGNADGLISSEVGWRYLEALPYTLQEPIGVVIDMSDWLHDAVFVNGTSQYDTTNCTSTEIGTGKYNTELLVEFMYGTNLNQNFKVDTDSAAAKVCNDLVTTHFFETFEDWFLPSLGEMIAYIEFVDVGDNFHFQTSSEYEEDADYMYCVHNLLSNYIGTDSRKNMKVDVVPIRAFLP